MSDKMNVAELFGQNVFNDKIMRERLPKKVYKELHKTIDDGKELDPMTAEVVAGVMKDWAVEMGATHYTHWFQPLPQRNMTRLLPLRTKKEAYCWSFQEKS